MILSLELSRSSSDRIISEQPAQAPYIFPVLKQELDIWLLKAG